MLNTWAPNTCLLNTPAGVVVASEPEVPPNPSIALQGLQAQLVLGVPVLKSTVISIAMHALQAKVQCPVHTLVPVAMLQGLAAPAVVGTPSAQALAALAGLRIKPVLGKSQLRAAASPTALRVTLRPGAFKVVMADVQLQGLQMAMGTDGLCLRAMVQVPPLFVRAKLHGPTAKTQVHACHLSS